MFNVSVFNIGSGFLLKFLTADITIVALPEGEDVVKADFKLIEASLERVRDRLNYRRQTWYTFELKRRENAPGFDVVSVSTESGQNTPVWRP